MESFDVAAQGRDPDFRRGESLHDRWWGDSSFGDGAASTVGPLDTAPYYAVRVRRGCLGTKGGPRTDTSGQVLDVDGAPLDGLYAAGNVMASVLGMTCGGAGAKAVLWLSSDDASFMTGHALAVDGGYLAR